MKAATPSFVTEIELLPTPSDANKIRSRFEAARQVYNAALGESLKRLSLMRESRLYRAARKMPKGQERTKAFKKAEEAVGFRKYDLGHWGTQFTKSWINEHLGANTCSVIVMSAFETAHRYSFGKIGRPRFRKAGELRAIEGRTRSCCRWKDGGIEWKGLTIPAAIDTTDVVVKHGLSCPVKYVRMVRKTIRGKERFFAQLVCEGSPYRKPSHKPTEGTVGVDIGPGTISVVGQKKAFLNELCPGLTVRRLEIARIQRRLNRSRRNTNPENYNENGTIKKDARVWIKSKTYHRLANQLAALNKQQDAHRKNLHGKMVADILALGNDVRLEKLDYVKLQQEFGKTVRLRAPGALVDRLKAEAAKWDATVTEFSTWTTWLSQTCFCGRVKQKGKGEKSRWHQCECGAIAQRDLFSAYLARFVEHDRLDADRAKSAWSDICNVVDAAPRLLKQRANGKHLPPSLGLKRIPSQSRRIENDVRNRGEAQDVVMVGDHESPREPKERRQHITFGRPFATQTSWPQ